MQGYVLTASVEVPFSLLLTSSTNVSFHITLAVDKLSQNNLTKKRMRNRDSIFYTNRVISVVLRYPKLLRCHHWHADYRTCRSTIRLVQQGTQVASILNGMHTTCVGYLSLIQLLHEWHMISENKIEHLSKILHVDCKHQAKLCYKYLRP
jgi:hypothetical protein